MRLFYELHFLFQSNHAKELQASLSDVTRELAESRVECGKLKSSLAEAQSKLKDASKVQDDTVRFVCE